MGTNRISRHFKRVIRYARPSDYAAGAATAAAGPALLLLMERIAPSYVGRGGFAPIMRLCSAVGLSAGFLIFYQSSTCMLQSPDRPE
jgi:NADH-ubiquinone oxidoreductase complex I, 21 kDa subunit